MLIFGVLVLLWLPIPSQPRKRAIALVLGGSGHCPSATTTPKTSMKTRFGVLILLRLPLPSQPQKRARLLVFWVLAAIHLPPQPRSFSGRHYPLNPENEQSRSFLGFWLSSICRHYLPNPKNEHDCSFSGFWPLSICRHYPPNSETEHSHSFLGFVAVSAIPNTKNAAFLAAFFVFGLFYSPFISPLLRHNKHNHFGHVFCVWVLLLQI